MRQTIALVMLLLLPAAVPAQEESGSTATEQPAPTPDVTIVQGGDRTIEEYRIHGRLYMIKVIPKKGAPYYLVDTDGDGNLESRRSELSQDLLIPNWTLLEWK
ncbi:MAG: DUF2782 domain-containing protein [Gammaproteobacteria bacterium]|nr:DUF2782 domain-containing protein [Gammaproteobacteria bacterium]